MQYFVENKNKFITIISPIIVLVLLSLSFWMFKENTHINLYSLLYLLFPIAIYTSFGKNFKGYMVSSHLWGTIFGFILQTIGVYGTLRVVYQYDSFYYFLLFFIIFYLFFIIDSINFKKASEKEYIRTKMKIDQMKVKREGNYYIDDMKFRFSHLKNTNVREEGNVNFYTIKIAMILGVPFLLFGKISVAFGIIAARYFPDSILVFYSALFIVGTILFSTGIVGLLTSLKLKLDDE